MGSWTRRRWRACAWAAACTLLVAGLGGLATDIGPWYRALKQPPWKPPDLAFGPAWTLIYGLTAWAAVWVWESLPTAALRRRWLGLVALNAGLNLGWSLLFFTARRPDWALAEVLLLWASIAVLVVQAWPHARRAALLLLPYLAWVGFAGALNLAVVRLN